jgi:hypothetical protein
LELLSSFIACSCADARDLAIVIASAVWHKMGTPNIRQCIKIAKMTKKKEEVDWLIQTMKKYQDSAEDWNV